MSNPSPNDSLSGSPEKETGQSRFHRERPSQNPGPARPFLRRRRHHRRRPPAPEPPPEPTPPSAVTSLNQLNPEELPEVEAESKLILAPSKRIVMEWSLVLTSQHIESTILFPFKQRWFLKVSATDYAHALEVIHLYLVENRHWGWVEEIPLRGKLFNWGTLYWALPTGLTYLLNTLAHDGLKPLGMMDSDQVLSAGQWWRVVSATFLHADIGHLASNLSLGLPLFGLAMGRYGIGWTLWAGLLAGICGNLLSLGLHPSDYASLGASGVVMGALGILSVYLLPWMKRGSLPTRIAFSALSASILIFVLTGLSPDPQVNISTHLGGFMGGIFWGVVLNRLPDKYIFHTLTNVVLTVAWFAFCSYCWWLAVEQP